MWWGSFHPSKSSQNASLPAVASKPRPQIMRPGLSTRSDGKEDRHRPNRTHTATWARTYASPQLKCYRGEHVALSVLGGRLSLPRSYSASPRRRSRLSGCVLRWRVRRREMLAAGLRRIAAEPGVNGFFRGRGWTRFAATGRGGPRRSLLCLSVPGSAAQYHLRGVLR